MSKPGELLHKIRKNFPDVSWKTCTYIDEGWDHEVIILDNKTVFRFPIEDDYAGLLQTENKVQNYIASKLSVRIPKYEYIPKDFSFVGYQMVPGIQLRKADFDVLSPESYDILTSQLSEFLSTIHTLDVTNENLGGVSNSYLADDQKLIRSHTETRLKPLLSQEDYTYTLEILDEVDDLLAQDLPGVFIHNDIANQHLIWDEPGKQLGIIDFSDMCIGDPATDFAELYEYGSSFVETVYDKYAGPKDATFLERAWKYQKWTGVYMMTDHFDSHKTSFAVARDTFDRIKLGKV